MLTPEQREAAERVIAAASIGCALDALTDAGFLLLHRDDVTEERALSERGLGRDAPDFRRRLVTRWEKITNPKEDA